MGGGTSKPYTENHRNTLALQDAKKFDTQGYHYYEQGNLSQAMEQYQKGLDIKEVVAPDSLDLVSSYEWIGRIYQDQSKFSEALEYHHKALNIRERKAPNSLDLANSYQEMGKIYYDQNKLSEALEY